MKWSGLFSLRCWIILHNARITISLTPLTGSLKSSISSLLAVYHSIENKESPQSSFRWASSMRGLCLAVGQCTSTSSTTITVLWNYTRRIDFNTWKRIKPSIILITSIIMPLYISITCRTIACPTTTTSIRGSGTPTSHQTHTILSTDISFLSFFWCSQVTESSWNFVTSAVRFWFNQRLWGYLRYLNPLTAPSTTLQTIQGEEEESTRSDNGKSVYEENRGREV